MTEIDSAMARSHEKLIGRLARELLVIHDPAMRDFVCRVALDTAAEVLQQTIGQKAAPARPTHLRLVHST